MCTAISRSAKLAGCLSAALFTVAAPGFASGLNLNSVPAPTAATQIAKAFHTNVVLGPGVNLGRSVTFNLADTSAGGGRTSAISYLAHDLDANRQTILVVGRSRGTAWKAPAALDTTANVTFTARTLPATAVFHQLAYVDDASVQYDVPVTGTVTLSDVTLPAPEAAREVAEQTHTSLAVIYELTGRGRPMRAPGGTVIGYTAGGQPITSDEVVTGAKRRMYAHRTTSKRYPHRTSKGSISITSAAAPSTTQSTTPAPAIQGDVPATVYQSQPGPRYYSLPQYAPGAYGPYWNTPYPFTSPLNWQWPYSIGNGGVIIVPTAPPPAVIVP